MPSAAASSRWFVLCLAFVAAGLATLHAAPRTALVIGNARYEPAVGKLRNSANDAKAVASTLRSLGFTVVEKENLTRDRLLQTLDEFRQTLAGAEIGLFYYAGHGLSIGGSNYLIPLKAGFDPASVTADASTLRMLAETRLFNADQIVAQMNAAGARCNLIILDACRNTPLARNARTRSLSGQPGLAEMSPPTGSLIAFAAAAGRVAFDGDGANGLYTEELLKNMRAPGLTIEQVFKRTRAAVIERSQGGQVPAEYSQLIGADIYLAGQIERAVALAAAEPAPRSTPTAPSDPATLIQMAVQGRATESLSGLKTLVSTRGPGAYAEPVFEALLERVKRDLKDAETPSTRVLAAVETCTSVIEMLPTSLPQENPEILPLTAKARNRRGDALLLLGRAPAAIEDFNAARELTPADAYILYNRGRAHLTLGQLDEARADFNAAADQHFHQPKARQLAEEALRKLGR